MVISRRSLPSFLLLWVLLLLATSTVLAQATAAAPETATQTQPEVPEAGTAAAQPAEIDPDTADISLTATVRMREIRFDATPQVRVEFSGQPERLTEDTTVRTNLPDKVQPGMVYRNVEIRLKIASVFADVDRIVAEVLGLQSQTEPQIPLAAPPAPAGGTERRP